MKDLPESPLAVFHEGERALLEPEGFEVLSALGFTVPAAVFVHSAEEALSVERMGHPVLRNHVPRGHEKFDMAARGAYPGPP